MYALAVMTEVGMNPFRRVLVSGASGFIGRALCQRLGEQGVRVRGLMRHATDGPWDEIVLSNLATESLPEDVLSGVDAIFHLAGNAHSLHELNGDEAEYRQVNVEGTRKLLVAAQDAGVHRFVFFSSLSVMESKIYSCIDESSPTSPTTPYGRSKLEAESLVLEGGYVPEAVALRPSMVYGPACKGNLPRMIEAVARGRFPPLPEVGNKRSMVHVEDVVQAALLAASMQESVGQTYIVTDGQAYSTRQMYEWICEALDKFTPKWVVPLRVLRALAKVGDGIGRVRGRRFMLDSEVLDKLVGSACYSSGKIERELGFRAKA